MSAAAVVERPRVTHEPSGERELGAAGEQRRRDSRSGGGRLTLEQLLDGVWEGLRANGAAECPVCRSQMTPLQHGGGHCGGCGATLS